QLRKRGRLAMGERQAFRHAAGRVGGNRRAFGSHDPPVNAADQVGEGSADVHANDVHAHSTSRDRPHNSWTRAGMSTGRRSANNKEEAVSGEGVWRSNGSASS